MDFKEKSSRQHKLCEDIGKPAQTGALPNPVSPSQLDGRHSNPVVTTPMIALDFSGTTHLSASHNVAFNQVINQSVNQAQDISPGTANLKPSLTGHDNSAAKQLKHNFKTEENSYPKAYTNRGTLGQDFTERVERTGSRVSSNPRFQSPNWYQTVEKLKRSSAPPISFKTTAGHGGNR
ncbi:hypothetical protein F511_11743 [Dorcoceras hygrometricum]|uniref:Uncharacterized protein n=1 Tax=Dorcoceras hygrometricum TaxID=472368 RepID=A0A2Z7C2Z4_9LAMI|nr:hypothetical protein F511_11743 [Dorcoceras hygrometricum]